LNQPTLITENEPRAAEACYQVVFRGLHPDVSPAEAKTKLAVLFKATQEQIDLLLTQTAHVVKKKCPVEVAYKYKAAIEAAGGACELIKESAPVASLDVDLPNTSESLEATRSTEPENSEESGKFDAADLDIDVIWEQIHTMEPPKPIREVDPKSYSQPATLLPPATMAAKKLVLYQRVAAVAIMPLAWWVVGSNFVVALVILAIWFQFPFGRGPIRQQKQARQALKSQAKNHYVALKAEWDAQGSEDIFQNIFLALESLRLEFDGLPKKLLTDLNERLADLKYERFCDYMGSALVEDANIEGVGPVLIEKLQSYGICSAADVRRGKIQSIPGFGQVREVRLLEWRAEVEAGFEFDPREEMSPDEYESVKQSYVQRGADITLLLAEGFHELRACQSAILSYRSHAAGPLSEAARALQQREADLRLC
jgi:DNA-binding helix-hairpin-helix protein with protein kinase domain